MPITPLHFGVLAPINHYAKGKVNNLSFMAVNVLIDAKSIFYGLTGYGAIDHGGAHNFFGVLVPIFMVSLLWFWRKEWWLGAIAGGFSHVALDMLVHSDMEPFSPILDGNPFYFGLMEPLSAVLLVLCVWLMAQYVSGIQATYRKSLGAVSALKARLFDATN